MSSTTSFMKFMQVNLFMLAAFGEDCYDYTRLMAGSHTTCAKHLKIDSAELSAAGDFLPVCERLCTDMMADRGVECTHFGIDSSLGSNCVFYTSCDSVRTAKQAWDTYEKYEVECPEEEAADALPEGGVSDAPIDTGVGPLPEVGPAPDDAYPEPEIGDDAYPAPVEMPQNAYILHMIQDRKVCSPVHLIGTHCSDCDVEACEAGCSGDENCEYFGFSSVGGLCYLYEKCDSKVMMGLKFDTYKKTFAAPVPDVPSPSSDVLGGDLSGQPAVPIDVPAPGAPTPEGPGDEGSVCDPSYEIVEETELSAVTCAKDWIIARKYNAEATVPLCADECTKDANCKFFGLSSIGTCVIFSGCETTRVTGKTWTTYEQIASSDPACATSDDASACASEPYTTSLLVGPDAWNTCAKSMQVRKVAQSGATEEDCRKACEVQHKTWKQGNDEGQCKFFALSNTGVCILYEECTETRWTKKLWTTWEMTPPACANDALEANDAFRSGARRRVSLGLPAPRPKFRRFRFNL